LWRSCREGILHLHSAPSCQNLSAKYGAEILTTPLVA
jgi:hypothetical protein